MKVKFKYGIATYSGTLDDMTYGNYRAGMVCIGRKWVMPRMTDINEDLGAIGKNISSIYADVSEGYKSDLKTYAYLYGKQKTPKGKLAPNGYALFVKLLYILQDENSGTVDLKTLTCNDIKTLFPEIVSIADAVENGFLPNLTGASLLTTEM